MHRSMVLLSVLFIGCSVGEVPINGGPGVDGGGGNPDGTASACATRVTPGGRHIHAAGGTSNQGQNCIVAGTCHGNPPGGGAPIYIAAGTLFKTGGTLPSGGAEIRLVADAGGAVLAAKTDEDGNFSITSATNPFPAHTIASGCPTTDAHMAGGITNAAAGGCNNAAACHQIPGGIAMVLADQ